MTKRTYELRVRLTPELAERLDRYAVATHRNTTSSVNVLLEQALTLAETFGHMDVLFRAPLTQTAGDQSWIPSPPSSSDSPAEPSSE